MRRRHGGLVEGLAARRLLLLPIERGDARERVACLAMRGAFGLERWSDGNGRCGCARLGIGWKRCRGEALRTSAFGLHRGLPAREVWVARKRQRPPPWPAKHSRRGATAMRSSPVRIIGEEYSCAMGRSCESGAFGAQKTAGANCRSRRIVVRRVAVSGREPPCVTRARPLPIMPTALAAARDRSITRPPHRARDR